MIECPSCEKSMKGHRCKCGYTVPTFKLRVETEKEKEVKADFERSKSRARELAARFGKGAVA